MSDQSAVWRKAFEFFDIDRDGTITLPEFLQCLKALGANFKKEDIQKKFEQLSGGPDKPLSYDNFVGLMLEQTQISRNTLRQYFEMFDKDGSGYVTTAEMRHEMTSTGVGLTDGEMNRLVNRYDADGGGTITIVEFEEMVADLGFEIVDDDAPAPAPAPAVPAPAPAPAAEPVDLVSITDPRLAQILKPLQNAEGKMCLTQVEKAVEYWQKMNGVTQDPESDPGLHWEKGRVKRGLGELIYKANHIALIVSDVGKSARFYTDVMGFQQIRRPDFDRHGAWFTMGNVELHLIKGIPVVHSGKDLIVGHISIETFHIDKVPGILKKLGVPFRQNVSVPKGKMAEGSGTNATNNSSNIVKQYFLRDPDGYYIEVCNCDVLTRYCLGTKQELAGYDEGVCLDVETATTFVSLGFHLANKAKLEEAAFQDMASALKDKEIKVIAKAVGCKAPADKVDEEALKKLLVRKTVYGDIVQNETEESLREILLLSNNKLPMALKIMEIRGFENKVFQPPAFFEEGETKTVPEAIHVAKKARTE